MLSLFRPLVGVWTLGVLASSVAAVPWDAPGGGHPGADGDDCVRVAASFVQIIGHHRQAVPHEDVKDDELRVCHTAADHRKTCCTRSVERHLQAAAVDDVREIVAAISLHLKDLLIINSELYRNEFLKLLSLSKNATKSTLSSTTYKLPPTEIDTAIDDLFLDLGHFMRQETKSMLGTITGFFDTLFPAVLVYTINDSDGALVPPDQRACFRKTRRDLSPAPFAEAIHRLSGDLDRSLGVARILLDAFDLAVEVINTTTHLHFEHECSRALTRLLYCSYCGGLTEVRPCRSLCMNVVHGCLAQVVDLNDQWNPFVDAVERVVLSMRGADDIEDVLGSVHSKISDSIMRTMETTQRYHSQLVSRCGPVVRVSQPDVTTPASTRRRRAAAEGPGALNGAPAGPPPPTARGSGMEVRLHLKIEMFVRNLAESREFYRKLPDSLCSSEKLSAGNYDVCWNGTSLGEYTRPVPAQDFSIQVADNPEMKVPESRHTTLLTISEKLRNMTKILQSRITPRLTNMQSDGRSKHKTIEMSGHGTVASGDDDDDDDDDDESGGSTDEPEDTDSVPPVVSGGKGGRKGVAEEGVAYVTSADFIFTEKSSAKPLPPHVTRPPAGGVVTITHTAAGSTFTLHKTGALLLPTLSTLILLRFL